MGILLRELRMALNRQHRAVGIRTGEIQDAQNQHFLLMQEHHADVRAALSERAQSSWEPRSWQPGSWQPGSWEPGEQ